MVVLNNNKVPRGEKMTNRFNNYVNVTVPWEPTLSGKYGVK